MIDPVRNSLVYFKTTVIRQVCLYNLAGIWKLLKGSKEREKVRTKRGQSRFQFVSVYCTRSITIEASEGILPVSNVFPQWWKLLKIDRTGLVPIEHSLKYKYHTYITAKSASSTWTLNLICKSSISQFNSYRITVTFSAVHTQQCSAT